MPDSALPLTRTLKPCEGVKGDDVYAVSRLLKQLGYRPSSQSATREFGGGMAAQTGAFQAEAGLDITGSWGMATHALAAAAGSFDQYGNQLLGNVCAPLVRDLEAGLGLDGGDVDAAARGLWRLGYRPPGQDRSGVEFGEKMAAQTAAFQTDRALPVDGVWGQKTHDQACALVGFDDYACSLLQEFAEEFASAVGATGVETTRSAIVDAAMLCRDHEPAIHYTQEMTLRMQGVTERIYPPDYPRYADCSSFATWCYFVSGWPDPNGVGYNGTGYTGTLVEHGRQVSSPVPSDLAFYGNPISHVAVCVSSTQVVSHGQESGPALYSLGYRTDLNHVRRYVE